MRSLPVVGPRRRTNAVQPDPAQVSQAAARQQDGTAGHLPLVQEDVSQQMRVQLEGLAEQHSNGYDQSLERMTHGTFLGGFSEEEPEVYDERLSASHMAGMTTTMSFDRVSFLQDHRRQRYLETIPQNFRLAERQ